MNHDEHDEHDEHDDHDDHVDHDDHHGNDDHKYYDHDDHVIKILHWYCEKEWWLVTFYKCLPGEIPKSKEVKSVSSLEKRNVDNLPQKHFSPVLLLTEEFWLANNDVA